MTSNALENTIGYKDYSASYVSDTSASSVSSAARNTVKSAREVENHTKLHTLVQILPEPG